MIGLFLLPLLVAVVFHRPITRWLGPSTERTTQGDTT